MYSTACRVARVFPADNHFGVVRVMGPGFCLFAPVDNRPCERMLGMAFSSAGSAQDFVFREALKAPD